MNTKRICLKLGITSIININKKETKDINGLKVDDQQATDPFVMSNNLK